MIVNVSGTKPLDILGAQRVSSGASRVRQPLAGEGGSARLQASITQSAVVAAIALFLLAAVVFKSRRRRRLAASDADQADLGVAGKLKRSWQTSRWWWLPLLLAMLPWRCARWLWQVLRRRRRTPIEQELQAIDSSTSTLLESLPAPMLVGSESDPLSVRSRAPTPYRSATCICSL